MKNVEIYTPDLHKKTYYRTVFISDAHLGYRGVKAQELYAFLNSIECQRLLIVGDFIDTWVSGRSWYWPEINDKILHRVLEMAIEGDTEVIYIPGNHDDRFRRWVGTTFSGIRIEQDFVHTTLNGKKLLVMHGDEFDLVVRQHIRLSKFSHHIFGLLRKMNRIINILRKSIGKKSWSLSEWVRRSYQRMIKARIRLAEAAINEAKERQLDGVICGHIHRLEQLEINGMEYWNTGDWMEDSTFIGELIDGTLVPMRMNPLIEKKSFDFMINRAEEFRESKNKSRLQLNTQLETQS